MICLTTYPKDNHEANVISQWFDYLCSLIPTLKNGNEFHFEPKENSIVTRERIFQILQNDMEFLKIENFYIKEV